MTIIDRNLSFGGNYTVRTGAPSGIVMHHAAANGSVEDIHDYHKNYHGWAGIGYHFYVRKDGNVYRGRPENWYGAHTVGHNDKLGICVEGNFETDVMGNAQKNAVVGLLADLRDRYGNLAVYRHKDFDATACPGANYPFDEIVTGKTQAAADTPRENRVLSFQQAALADGIDLSRYGTDGIWGEETAAAASELVADGSVGKRVELIQRLLGGLAVDGIFGANTDRAVRAFQRTKRLSVDGIVGINTWKAMLGV